MKLRPASRDLSELYRRSQLLNPPHSPSSFLAFLSRLKKFDRDAVISAAGQVMWKLYKLQAAGGEPAEGDQIDAELVEGLGPLLVSLACLHCKTRRAPIEGFELQILIWELHSVSDPFLDGSLTSSFNLEVRTEIKESGSVFLPTAPTDQELAAIRSFHFRARLARQNMQHRMQSFLNLIYSWGIQKELQELMDPADTLLLENTTLGLPALQFLRTGFAIFTLAMDEKLNAGGFVLLESQEISEELAAKWGFSSGDFQVVAKRLSTDMRGRSEKIDASKHSIIDPAVQFFLLSPLVELAEYSKKPLGRVVAPSPRAYLYILGRYVDSICLRGDVLPKSLSPQEISSLRGRAFENFLKKIVPQNPNVIWADSLNFPPLKKGMDNSRPDLIWYGDEYVVLVELKFDVRPNHDPLMLQVRSMLKAWEELAKGVKQITGFLETKIALDFLDSIGRSLSNKRLVIVLCTADELLADGTSFLRAANVWDVGKGSTVSGITAMSASTLVSLMRDYNSDFVGKAIEEHWSKFDGMDPEHEQLPELFWPHHREYRKCPHEESLEREAFPSLSHNNAGHYEKISSRE